MKFKSLLSAAALALSVTPLMATPAQADDNSALELLEPGVLQVATMATDPPYSWRRADGKLDGMEIRLVKEVAKRLHLEYRPVITKWDSIIIGIESNKFDMSSAAMDITAERQKQIVYADGWVESGGRLLVPKDSDMTTEESIKGTRVGALVSSTYAQQAIDHGAELKSYVDVSSAIQDMANGNLDGIVNDSISNAYLVEKMHLPFKQTVYMSHIQKGWGFAKGKPNLVAAVNKALADMKADGTYAKLLEPLIGMNPAPKDPVRTLPQYLPKP